MFSCTFIMVTEIFELILPSCFLLSICPFFSVYFPPPFISSFGLNEFLIFSSHISLSMSSDYSVYCYTFLVVTLDVLTCLFKLMSKVSQYLCLSHPQNTEIIEDLTLNPLFLNYMLLFSGTLILYF